METKAKTQCLEELGNKKHRYGKQSFQYGIHWRWIGFVDYENHGPLNVGLQTL